MTEIEKLMIEAYKHFEEINKHNILMNAHQKELNNLQAKIQQLRNDNKDTDK